MLLRSLIAVSLAALMAACSSTSVTRIVTPFRIDVRQGNYVSPELLAQLKPGMTREQVRMLMGSPMLVDIFHADRWDYVYRNTVGYAEPETWRATLFFEGERYVRTETAGIKVASSTDVPLTPRVIDITGPAASAPAAAR